MTAEYDEGTYYKDAYVTRSFESLLERWLMREHCKVTPPTLYFQFFSNYSC